ncbi:hypothetical protein MTR67_019205 [Solanum verrucosum]|uniref:Transposase MuDR plant domain-containing protein n=1 Tax=Solanum verrucosum TaxID=315347 RepID=A0AAF0QNQ5_SOLVR|nr:hypothetical protein MTR67_019205 [Solanum verrucosum]
MLDAEAIGGVDLQGRRKSKKVRYDDQCIVAIFELGMIFENAKEFRKALAKYTVEKNYQIKLRRNEAHRVRAKCKFKEKCKWLCYGAIDRDSGDFMIKNYYLIHKCLPSNKNKMCTTKFLASRFKDEITKQPSLRIWEIQELCREELGLKVGRRICYKAKMMILRENMGDWNMEFSRLCDYTEVIKQTNPGSSVWVRMDREIVPGKNLFVYFYVCLDALKKGWKEGCRRMIGFDGCFLKGACKGELLVAVGRNGNNQMFPIAWAVVDKETKHSWSFFINYLKEDLVKRARKTAKTSQPPPFVDTSIPVIRGITSQLPPKTRQTAGQKRGRVATGEDSARGGPKRPTNGGSSNVGFGIYTSASGTQILNPRTSSQRILPTDSSYKVASLTGIDLGFKTRGLRWKNKDAVTTSQLQQMANKKKK